MSSTLKRIYGWTVLAVLTTMWSAASAQTTPAVSRTLVVSGSSTVYPLMVDIAGRFERLTPGLAMDIRAIGSARGIANVRAETADIAMVSRPLAENEKDLFAFPICRDGAAIVVHGSNPIKALSARQLTEILTGGVHDWKQLGGRSGPIRLAWRTEGQAIPELLLQHLKLKGDQIRSHATYFENVDAVRFVERDRNGVTVAALAVAERRAKSGAPISLVTYEGVAASTRTVRDRTYTLSRPLLLVTRSVPTGVHKRFVDYAVSAAVTDLQAKHGFVPYEE